MELQLKTHHLDVPDDVHAYIDRKVGKLDRLLDRVVDAALDLREAQHRTGGQRVIAQLTIATNFAVLRAEEDAPEIHAAIDAVTDKMERQILRYRSKWKSRRSGHHEPAPEFPELAEEIDAPPDEELATPIIRTKTFSAKPIDAEEAIEQMELLGHAFFAFIDVRTGNVHVVYRRHDGGYGVLQPA